jgi:hypothetical protein
MFMKKLLLPVSSFLLFVAIVLTFKHILFPPAMTNAYLIGSYEKKKKVVKKLEKAGFTIISTSKVGKKKMDLVIFSHPELQALANQPKRGFLTGVLRVLINKKDKEIRISSPTYFLQAFLQDDYKADVAEKMADLLNGAFSGLKPSSDQWPEDSLKGFQYMIGMPGYQDVTVLGEGSVEELVAKIDKKVKKKQFVFKEKLAEDRYVYGVMPGKRTSKFVDKIGPQNALALPWMILIEDGKAVTFDGKYFIALSYPLLSMDQFMTIATIPGAIEKDMKKLFK